MFPLQKSVKNRRYFLQLHGVNSSRIFIIISFLFNQRIGDDFLIVFHEHASIMRDKY